MKNMKIMNNWREPSEMSMVLENITRVDGEIQQKIFQLGQVYYENNKDNQTLEGQYFALVDSVKKLEENRKGFYKNKLRLEGQMMCENCGAIISYGSVYCSVCGKKADEKSEDLGELAKLETAKCKGCGAALEKGSLFCASCGKKVE